MIDHETNLPLRIKTVCCDVFLRQEKPRCGNVVDPPLLFPESNIQGDAESGCMICCKDQDCVLEGACVCLASGLHPSCDLRGDL